MASVNKVMLLGNLTRDPEIRYTPKGTAVTDLGMAVNRVRTGDNGERIEEVTYVDVTLWGRQAESRLGDGLGPLLVGEVTSLSLCGMGGNLICEILEAEPEKVPDVVVVQANRDSHKVRMWAQRAGFHLVREQMVSGRWAYQILTLHRCEGPDPAYANVDLELSYYFGPRLLKDRDPVLLGELARRLARHREHPENRDLQRVKAALRFVEECCESPGASSQQDRAL